MLIRTHTIQVDCRAERFIWHLYGIRHLCRRRIAKHLRVYRFAAIFPGHKIPDNKIIKRIESIFITTAPSSAWHHKQTANNAPFNHHHRPHRCHRHQILTQTRLLIYLFEIRSQPMVGTTMASPAVRKYIWVSLLGYWLLGMPHATERRYIPKKRMYRIRAVVVVALVAHIQWRRRRPRRRRRRRR